MPQSFKNSHLHFLPFFPAHNSQLENVILYTLCNRNMKKILHNTKYLTALVYLNVVSSFNYSATLVEIQSKHNIMETYPYLLSTYISSLKCGIISHEHITSEVMFKIIRTVIWHLNEHHPNFKLLFTHPDYYYAHPAFFCTKHNNNIYIVMKYPISS